MLGGTVEQREHALQLANHVRCIRAEVKRDLRELNRAEGLLKAADLLEAPSVELEGMKVEALLGSIFRIGETKVHRLMLQAGISSQRTIGGITGRQRAALVSLLRGEDRG